VEDKRYTACMREQPMPHFAGLDIGTSRVRCVVGTIDPHDPTRASIIGHGSSPNRGMRKGVIAHLEDVVEAIAQAINEAERVSGMQLHHVTVNVNGSHVMGINSKGVIAISSANREISPHDRMRAEEAATIVQLPPNREIIQVFAKNYSVDGQDNIKDPVGMQGVRLEVDTHIVTGSTPNVRSIEQVLEKLHLQAAHKTVSGLAAAEAVLTREQKEAGTLLLDIGAGTTNLAIIEDGEVQYVGVIPIGGTHVTNDLAIGLKTDLDIAERVKIEHAAIAGATDKKLMTVKIGKKQFSFDGEEVIMIAEARIEELLEYVDKELKRIHKSRKLPGGIVIVGGTAKLPGLAEFTKEKLQLAARIGKLQPVGGLIDTVNDTSFASATGLMLLDMLLVPPQHQVPMGGTGDKFFGVVDGVLGRFRRKS
jgi:cell division protein FtsA